MKNQGKHYIQTRYDYTCKAEEILHDFIIDELSECGYKQLRYEAACTSLKELKNKIDAMPTGKIKDQAFGFYRSKLSQLEQEALNYSSTPYTL
jgi:hypothetical protein